MTNRRIIALVAGILAAGALANSPSPAPEAPQAGPSLFETLVLMRWGYGALGWLAFPDNGDSHERTRERRG